MRAQTLVLALSLLPSCGGLPEAPGDPTSATVDAAAGGGSGDARRGATTMDVVCQPYAQTMVRASDGVRAVTTNRYAIVDAVKPGDEFDVEWCGFTVTQIPAPGAPGCPQGYTCSGSVGPEGPQCTRVYRTGTFIESKLLISCGSAYENYAANGALISSTDYSYTSIRLTY